MSEQTELAFLHSKPTATGDLRTEYEDFKVFEMLPFAPTGEGEHLFIHIRKTGANTLFVAKQLEKYFKVKSMHVGYAGLKDRNAVTEQFFGIHLPGKQEYDLSDLKIEGVEILSIQRHNKKLKTGALLGNRFEITLRNVSDVEDVQQRWQKVVEQGVPNYFGEQRFGRDGHNIDAALAMFAGKKVKDKKKRSFYLSAARSYLFNKIVEQRIEQGLFAKPLAGDVFMLNGSRSIFSGEEINDEILARLKSNNISITAPMWGAGELLTEDDAKQLELDFAKQHQQLCDGLVEFGLKQERRRMQLTIDAPKFSHSGNTVTLSFFLPAGCFATTILREVIDYKDIAAQRVFNAHKSEAGKQVSK
mgnify:CR=1 FL=1